MYMQFITQLFVTILGWQLIGKSKRFQNAIEKQIAPYRRAASQPATLMHGEWARVVWILVALMGVILFPFLMMKLAYVPLQQQFFGNGAVIIPYDGQYLFMIAMIFVWPVLMMLLTNFLWMLWPSLGSYMVAVDLRDQLVHIGKVTKQKTVHLKHGQLEELASQYDLNGLMHWRMKRGVLAFTVVALLALPCVYLALNSFMRVTSEGVAVSRVWQLSTRAYTWENVEKVEMLVAQETDDSGEAHATPQLLVTLNDGSQIDLWQFGVLERPAEDIISLCTAFDEHGIAVEQHPMSDISALRISIQEDIQEVYDTSVCGAFSVCGTLEGDSLLRDLLECTE